MRQACQIDECAKPVAHRGWCSAHYKAWLRHGDPLVRLRRARGTGSLTEDRYITVLCPSEFESMGQGNGRNAKRVLLHRLVMARHLQRCLLPGETVHHRNGDRQNNALRNLELRVGAHGKHQAVEDAVEWACELLRRYAPERLA